MLLSIFALLQTYLSPQLHPAPSKTISNIQQQAPWSGKFFTKKFSAERTDKLKIDYIKKQLRLTIRLLPKWHTAPLKKLEIHNDTHLSRGLSSAHKMILHVNSIESSQELRSVFIHELGHIVDLGALTGKNGRRTSFKDGSKHILSDDLSTEFYRISWTKADQKLSTSNPKDFVSGYAQYDCFEDFAESYLMYRLHGEKFRELSQNSDALQKKYNFMKANIFNNQEFNLNRTAQNFQSTFDATLLSSNN